MPSDERLDTNGPLGDQFDDYKERDRNCEQDDRDIRDAWEEDRDDWAEQD